METGLPFTLFVRGGADGLGRAAGLLLEDGRKVIAYRVHGRQRLQGFHTAEDPDERHHRSEIVDSLGPDAEELFAIGKTAPSVPLSADHSR